MGNVAPVIPAPDLFSNVHSFASSIPAISLTAFASEQSPLCFAQPKQALFTAAQAPALLFRPIRTFRCTSTQAWFSPITQGPVRTT